RDKGFGVAPGFLLCRPPAAGRGQGQAHGDTGHPHEPVTRRPASHSSYGSLRFMCRTGIVLLCLLVAVPASAQSAYVVGSIGAEVSRMSRVESFGFALSGGDGEVLGGSLRVG